MLANDGCGVGGLRITLLSHRAIRPIQNLIPRCVQAGGATGHHLELRRSVLNREVDRRIIYFATCIANLSPTDGVERFLRIEKMSHHQGLPVQYGLRIRVTHLLVLISVTLTTPAVRIGTQLLVMQIEES